MIKSFAHKGLSKFFHTGSTAGIQAKHAIRLAMILKMLDRAKVAGDMAAPGLDLHALKGNRKGLWSVKVNGNWRITFHFTAGSAEIVDYIDYH
jgi:proteic killer suppression protein